LRAEALPRWSRPLERGPEAGAPGPSRFRLPEDTMLARRLELLGLHPVRGVRVTDNRSVMVSLSPKGVLRIHRGYALAPDRILKAVVRFVAPRTPRALRRAAEHEILSFRPEDHAAGPLRRRRRADRLERLALLFEEYNARHFGGALPVLPFRISGRMRTRLGQLCIRHETGEPYEITMSRGHMDRHGWAEASHTLLHEMVHVWQHQSGHAVDHGAGFRRKAAEVGVVGSARRTVRTRYGRGRAARID
jgi:hypothetical protein